MEIRMIFDTFVKLYETDTIHEFKEKIFTNFCQDYCISAINDIRIQNGKLYGDVPEYNRNDFIDAYVKQILSVTLDKKMIDILSTESVDDSSIKMIIIGFNSAGSMYQLLQFFMAVTCYNCQRPDTG